MTIDKDENKILLVCKESYTYPMSLLRDELLGRGFEVEALFVHITESIFPDHSYTSFLEANPRTRTYTFNDAAIEYWANYKNAIEFIDYRYLDYVEKTYCQDLPIGLLLMSSQYFTTPYHYRFYFRDLSEEEKLYWVQLLFKSVEEMINSSKPSKILDIDNSVMGRSILHLVAKQKGILYTTLESSRHDSSWLPTYTLGRETDKYFLDAYSKLIDSKEIQEKYINAVHEFRERDSIILSDYKFNSTGKKSSTPFLKDLRRLGGSVYFLLKEWRRNVKYSGVIRRRPLIASYAYSIVFFITWFVRERYLLSRFSNFFEMPNAEEKYVYFPLHLIPESTTLLKSPFYPNELSIIEAVSKALPLGWKLYVKEHGAMIGERPLSFYSRIKRLTNVKVVKMDAFKDPKDWISNSIGVITLTGSAAYEAAMLGKKALMFGNAYFEVMDGVEKVSSFQELPEKIRAFTTENSDNVTSCAAYIQLVESLGLYIPLAEILVESREVSVKGGAIPEKLREQVNKLADLLLSDLR